MFKIKKSTKLGKILELGKECKRCGHCCIHGSGFVLKQEIKRLAEHFKITEAAFAEKYLDSQLIFNNIVHKFKTIKQNKKPYGTCILFDRQKGCTIQEIKPLHCRIGNCSRYGEELSAWFTVNCLVNPNDAESVRQFSIYISSGGKTIPGGELKDITPDKTRLNKILGYKILK